MPTLQDLDLLPMRQVQAPLVLKMQENIGLRISGVVTEAKALRFMSMLRSKDLEDRWLQSHEVPDVPN